MKRKKILVVGGAGFIGSYVTLKLNEQGIDTIVYDNLSTGSRESVVAGDFIEGDLGDEKTLSKVFNTYSIDAVMHFAALINVGDSVQHPCAYYNNNVVKTLTLLDTMRKSGVRHFIFSSSAAVYGIPNQVPLDETHPKNPINPYGRTKWMVEQILQDYQAAYDFRSISLRYFNAAGGDPTGQIKNKKLVESNLIPVALRCLKENRPLTIFGNDYPTKDGTCVRDYIHIVDLAEAHLLALDAVLKQGVTGAFNLGNGQGYTVKEVVDAIERVTEKKLNQIQGPRREGDPPTLLADARLAFNTFGWRPKHPNIDTMIEDAWQGLS